MFFEPRLADAMMGANIGLTGKVDRGNVLISKSVRILREHRVKRKLLD
jgi:hypothetical protein